MNAIRTLGCLPIFFRVAVLALTLAVWPPVRAVAAAEKPDTGERRTTVAVCDTEAGTLLQREGSGKAWKVLKPKQDVYSRDLIVALPGAALDTKNGAIHLSLLSDLAGQSPYPVLESAVVLHDNPKVDLDFTLNRGRVDVTNRKDKGPAHVLVRFRDAAWELTLDEGGTEVALELYARWPTGVPFSAEPKPDSAPLASVILLVREGSIDLKAGLNHYRMQAPPGPASFLWDSANGPDAGPKRLDKLPDWANPKAEPTDEAKKLQAAIERLRRRLVDNAVPMALAETLESKDALDRRVAIINMGATDELPGLVNALGHDKLADVRDGAVVVLRHWIGRGPGQDGKLYRFLMDQRKYSAGQAEIVLQLLHSFSDVDRDRRETYESLIAYLEHDKLPIRELAKWHLYRMVAAAKDIPYDPAGSEAERDRAAERWRKLLREGKLPPKAEPKPKPADK
jgi:hypothetical protein